MNPDSPETRTVRIHVPVLARVEGEGALEVRVEDGQIHELRLRIYEPPRLFEQFMVGHHYSEVPDLVARICGICPVAYQMSAVQALEGLFGVDPGPWVSAMRRLFYCGEWLQSHALHIHLLAAPDFLGFDNALAMSARHGDDLRRGLRLQALGNALIRLFGARSVHPVGARVGGFWKAPEPENVASLLAEVRAALPEAQALVAWTAALPLPQIEQAFTCVALRDPQGYPMTGGRIVSDGGLDIGVEAFERRFHESQAPHSTALHGFLDGRPYLVGPLARLNLSLDRLHPDARAALEATRIPFPSRNMYHSIVARAVEIYQALLEAAQLLDAYRLPERPYVPIEHLAGSGFGATEAPRGLLWHRYDVDANGLIDFARIVPPTSQNQPRIEEDLRQSLMAVGLDQDEDVLRLTGESVIRNYDPCISCATHFLRLDLSR